jgi:hypothetical protein
MLRDRSVSEATDVRSATPHRQSSLEFGHHEGLDHFASLHVGQFLARRLELGAQADGFIAAAALGFARSPTIGTWAIGFEGARVDHQFTACARRAWHVLQLHPLLDGSTLPPIISRNSSMLMLVLPRRFQRCIAMLVSVDAHPHR